jgi:NADP-dependent 3-hydroxy acid dehydrogenase YdfG
MRNSDGAKGESILMSKHLSGKTAIVTGASAGIGRATALALAEAGAAVVLAARRVDRLEELAGEIVSKGGAALPVAGDVGNPSDTDRLLEETLAWKEGGRKYDIVIGNAGRGLTGSVLDSDEAQWEEVFRTNVLGLAHLLREVGKYMAERKGGDIVVLGSVAGRNISPVSAVYGSSKFAVSGLVEGLRRELCNRGVRVSLVMPGIVLSEFQGVAGYKDEVFGKWVGQFGILLTPEDVARSIEWMVSLPPHVNISEIMVRPTGQPYP